MNKKEAVIHYETQARAALYPELVRALRQCVEAAHADIVEDLSAVSNAADNAAELLSRLPAERDKGAG